MLSLIKSELLHLDEKHIAKTGVKRCWFVDNHSKVVAWLKYLHRPQNPALRGVDSFDFSTMYTTLELDDLVSSVKGAITEAFQNYRLLRFHHRKCSWIKEDDELPSNLKPSHPSLLNADEVSHLVEVLVRNTFIQNGQCLKQQSNGLPMGTNPAPHIADLCCYRKESVAMDLLSTVNIALARKFIGTFRFIDDILSCDNPLFKNFVFLKDRPHHVPIRAIYPTFLQLSQTNSSPLEATYLGMLIKNLKNKFHIKVAKTEKKLPFPKINYPSLLGNFPRVLGLGVFTGQLHRFASICSSTSDFVQNAITMSNKLVPKGYSKRDLHQKFKSFVNSPHFKYKSPLSLMCKHFKSMVT